MKKMVFAGKYDGDESKLPQREHPEGSVPVKEPDLKQMAIWANVASIALVVLLLAAVLIRGHEHIISAPYGFLAAALLSMVCLVPHEFLHAVCFRETVSMYHDLGKGLLFVVGTEDMSKTRFILMSLLPNAVFGFVPLLIGLAVPSLVFVGVFGAICTSMGCGDYINIWNIATQVPKGARTYLCGTHSYWYQPQA